MIRAYIRTTEGEEIIHSFGEDKVKYVYNACLKLFGGCKFTTIDANGVPTWNFRKATVKLSGNNIKIKAGYRSV